MRSWWMGLTARERLVILAGAGVLAALALLQLVFAPVVAWRAGAEKRALAAEENYRLVHRSASLAAPRGSEAAASEAPVRNVLNETAAMLQIELTFVNALPDGSVDVQAGPVAPERIYELFSTLERTYGVEVKAADMARAADDPNAVRIQATLAR